jgi:hypothetical protein
MVDPEKEWIVSFGAASSRHPARTVRQTAQASKHAFRRLFRVMAYKATS